MSEGFIRDFLDKMKSQSAYLDRNSRPRMYRPVCVHEHFLERMSFFGHYRLDRQTPYFVRCLFRFQLYPFMVAKVKICRSYNKKRKVFFL